MSAKHTLREIAQRFSLELHGDPECIVHGVATISGATQDQLTFLANRAYRRHLANTRAGAVILSESDLESCTTNALVADDPYLAYASVAQLFASTPVASSGVDPRAAIAESAELGEDVAIAALSFVGARVRVGAGTSIAAGAVVEDDVELGPGCQIHPRAVLCRGVKLGARVIVHPGAVIGADGFGLVQDEGHWRKIPQLGSVVIGDDCEIGANTTIDRGAIEDTVLEEDVRLDNLVQLGHNVRVGAHTAIAGCTGIAGSTTVGARCQIAGAVSITGHVEIADDVVILGMSGVTGSVRKPGVYAGNPLQSHAEYRRNAVRLRRLDKWATALEKKESQ